MFPSTLHRTVLNTMAALALSITPVMAQDQRLVGVVELFTSQGCSSCPPADKALAAFAARDDVLALSFHVDYWNYLGWQDTFSHARFTERQRRYATSFKERGVYTPQAVVNGRTHVVGSRAAEIDGLLKAYGDADKGLKTSLSVSKTSDVVQVTAQQATGNATLWLVSFDRTRDVDIKRGENRGRRITYHNVVRGITMLGMMKDGGLDVSLPLAELSREDGEGGALLLQETTGEGTPGAIIGAAFMPTL